MSEPLLELRQVSKSFRRPDRQTVTAVAGVSLAVAAEECLALVGESGSGKSTVARLALHLLDPDQGQVCFQGRELGGLSRADLQAYRRAIQPVFQDTAATFNPRRSVRDTLGQALRQARTDPADLDRRTIALLDSVRLPGAAALLGRYPHELSGGQRQRLAIARALAIEPRLIVADEPLSGADASIRGQILNLLTDLQRERRVAYLFITHDIGVARAFSQRVAVMYRGRVVEEGATPDVLDRPGHPYTRELLAASPTADGRLDLDRSRSRPAGPVPFSDGCRFLDRCPLGQAVCRAEEPRLRAIGPGGHRVACHLAEPSSP